MLIYLIRYKTGANLGSLRKIVKFPVDARSGLPGDTIGAAGRRA
jgi:hypothetical protein